MSKKRSNPGGLVYSTDPNFKMEENNADEQTISPAQQKLRIRLDTKNRGGKAVTLVEGFVGTNADREELGKKLKSFCATGGSVKEGEIIVQGDNRDKVMQCLQKNGFAAAKRI